MESTPKQQWGLSPYLSPIGAWAFALGTSIGWGSLVVTSNTYLLQAGPWGSILGLLVGAVVMVIVARNYHYMINCFPDAGGAYTYSKQVFGYDFGFMSAWFASLTYIAMLWANATSLPLFARYFIGDVFRVGYLYSVFGYDVYLGEAALTIAAIVVVALLLTRSRKAAMHAMVAMALLLSAGITVCFLAALGGFGSGAGPSAAGGSLSPEFLPDQSALSQIMLIACISPWAYIGFENISHSAEEFCFSRTKTFRVMVTAIMAATALYVFVFLLSVMAFPTGYDSWFAYISDLGNLSGVEGLPAFYAAHYYLGDAGVGILMAALLALIGTSLVGNTVALSRLFHALAKDAILPRRFATINRFGVPGQAVMLVAAVSVIIPFLGRTAIGWIVDVTVLGATVIYGFVSASTFKVARARHDPERITGALGVAFMVAIGAYLLLPSLFSSQSLATESYFLFAAWGILGFLYFRYLLSRDTHHRFGRSTIVWIFLLALVMFVSFVWMAQSLMALEDAMESHIMGYFNSAVGLSSQLQQEQALVIAQLDALQQSSYNTMLVAAIMFALAAGLLLTNFSYMSKWAQASEHELDVTRDIIFTDPLTGLPSLMRFQELARAGADAIAKAGGRPVALALDLVGMVDFRNEHGRDESDVLLRVFADVLRRNFGDEACTRFSDGSFYALAPLSTAAAQVEAVFNDFKAETASQTLPVRVGAHRCSSGEEFVESGLSRARVACDLDKKTWQSHIVWYSEAMSAEARLRMYVLDRVDQAIAERWISPYYQAVTRAATGEICGEEALARWIDPELGFLSPAQFIPVLEGAGLLHKVDMHIIDCVLADIGMKREAGMPIVPVSVNVSLTDVGQIDIAAEIARRVDEAGVAHNLLHIEFTESAASADPELFKAEVGDLRAAGFEVWMDDFGSGYSSLNSLKDFDFDVIKLDMDFLRGDGGTKTWDVIAGVVDITRRIGIRSLAEGVEDEQQARRLRDIGCDMLQGFFFAHPKPVEDVIERFRTDNGAKYEVRFQ